MVQEQDLYSIDITTPKLQNFIVNNYIDGMEPAKLCSLFKEKLDLTVTFKEDERSGQLYYQLIVTDDYWERWTHDDFMKMKALAEFINQITSKYSLPAYTPDFKGKTINRIYEYEDTFQGISFSVLIFEDNTFYPLNGVQLAYHASGEEELHFHHFTYSYAFFKYLNKDAAKEFWDFHIKKPYRKRK